MALDQAVAAVRLAVRRDLDALEAQRAPAGPDAADGSVLVACSGGADSLALLAAAVFEARARPWRVVGVVVDHGLQDGSAEHTARVVAQMAVMGADETVSVRVQVSARGQGPEAAAREARYAVLEEVAQRFGAVAVLLGHTLDDQAETVLLGLTRGSGARSLAGMRRSFTPFRRPLLDLTREQTEQACRAQRLEWWSDPHNDDPRFTRSRVRHRVLPVLEEELGPGVAATLARTADQLREDAAALDGIAAATYDRLADAEGLQVGELAALPAAVRSRVLRLAAVDAGSPPSELFWGHVTAVAGLVDPSGAPQGRQVHLPGRVTAHRDGHLLRFRRTAVPG